MIRRHSSTAPTLKSPTTEAGPQPESGSIGTNGIADEAEWERALFLQPTRLAEARRHDAAQSHRWSGLLLAGLAALAVGVGDVRAADDIPTTGEDSSIAFDYWAWLASWFDGSTENESSLQQKNDEGTTDPGEGD
jgi:hypothetical protein